MKTYRTHFTSWNKTRGEYEQETETAEILYKYSLYERNSETFDAPLILFAIGGNEKNNFSSNWDIYASKRGTLYSIPRPGSGCRGTFYGDTNHIRHLMRQGYFSDTLTEYGRQLMNT